MYCLFDIVLVLLVDWFGCMVTLGFDVCVSVGLMCWFQVGLKDLCIYNQYFCCD